MVLVAPILELDRPFVEAFWQRTFHLSNDFFLESDHEYLIVKTSSKHVIVQQGDQLLRLILLLFPFVSFQWVEGLYGLSLQLNVSALDLVQHLFLCSNLLLLLRHRLSDWNLSTAFARLCSFFFIALALCLCFFCFAPWSRTKYINVYAFAGYH